MEGSLIGDELEKLEFQMGKVYNKWRDKFKLALFYVYIEPHLNISLILK